MIQISALPAFTDNYLWLLQDPKRQRCAVVDPGDAAPVLDWLRAHKGWQLTDILVTHHHRDHQGGVLRLKQASGARVFGPAGESIQGCDRALAGGETTYVLGLEFAVLAVPGHTLGHIAYFHKGDKDGREAQKPLLFCGDTLFAAGCGRIFEGTAAQMYASLMQLAALPDSTQIYCAHEYTLSNLRFAASVEPDNPFIQQRLAEVSALRAQGKPSLPSTLASERQTNPFLRCHLSALASRFAVEAETPEALFAHLRGLKDRF